MCAAFCLSEQGNELRNLCGQSGDGHDKGEDVADGHADAEGHRLLVADTQIIAPDHENHEESAERSRYGGRDVRHQDQLGRGSAVAEADDHREGEAGEASVTDELRLEADVLIEAGAEEYHTTLGIRKE